MQFGWPEKLFSVMYLCLTPMTEKIME